MLLKITRGLQALKKNLNLKVRFTIESKCKDKKETFCLLTRLNWLDCVNNRNTEGKTQQSVLVFEVDFSVSFEDHLNG